MKCRLETEFRTLGRKQRQIPLVDGGGAKIAFLDIKSIAVVYNESQLAHLLNSPQKIGVEVAWTLDGDEGGPCDVDVGY